MGTGSRSVYVCKVGGSIIEGVHPSIVENIKAIVGRGEGVVLVHGGGDYVTEVAERLGKKQVFVTSPEGIRSRYTDRETAEIYTMVMSGLLAKRIVLLLERSGLGCVSLSGVDYGLIRAERKKRLTVIDERGRKVVVEGGYTGRITSVNTHILGLFIEQGIVPVVSPVALGEEYELLNVDGDRACAGIAGALEARCAVFLTDVEGVYSNGELVRTLSVEGARALLPKVGNGMDVKLLAAVEAVEKGAHMSVISSGLKENPIDAALRGEGTVIRSGV
ncbi:acetylglutamate kinase [Candidatus Marsarchaeota G2 archaeon ECH_B_SAG-C16]|jgi:acetylglutamate kinase|uniref:Putative [LysW]-aminoadipate/[LysW]-glutamate kinase n=5 Tax=Candidatus Marsarchaeota group 2 TaxID=2203771 RepID=A0A2R6CEU8_9ARCH|nr:MAG: acetylglutamate kinase [Candidatus Marsarchaeota G2 archaeon ECH_B_SAG-C16]PSN94035.1 MAG: acetylglutamate kinase [Candidatus Marsarchaeota G2 archaeon ECH_B_2]PSN98632.1 MAG: acetylglutamate kinase [Candidatus Marsarchaeota G2 archaeon ECH_B_3]PSO00506.1 MAG: acetylglutamate kinase [Candidatus Marsarchaeota G2 archaeon ECH_B_1]PSO09424.1 MAG: acetylglutamate kinase [Candidatus Marsarchaeota G2 archaeon BE_D]